MPTCYLAELLDRLTFVDNISLSLHNQPRNSDNFVGPLTDNEIKEFKFPPFPHQVAGVNFLLDQQKTLLLDSMGVG